MRTLIKRWTSMGDPAMDKTSENLVAIHWILLGLAIIGWRLIPLIQGVSPEVYGSLLR